MSDVQDQYFVVLSHSYPEDPSGPARSYWDVKYGNPEGRNWNIGYPSLCTPFSEDSKKWEPRHVAYMLNEAVKRGRKEMQGDFKRLMGIK